MKDADKNCLIISHNAENGYDFYDNVCKLVKEKEVQNYVASYISMLTSYASEPKYVSRKISTTSYFTKDNYAFWLTSTPKKDSRFFLESEIRLLDFKDLPINLSKHSFSSAKCESAFKNEKFKILFQKGMMLALLSKSTTMYLLVDEDSAVEDVFFSFFKFDRVFLCRNSCVEVIGKIPEVTAAVIICRCLCDEDKYAFIHKIESKSNYVLVDLVSQEPNIVTDIKYPSYSQSVLSKIQSDKGFAEIYNTFVKTAKSLNETDLRISKDVFYNAVSYCCLRQRYAEYIKRIPASSKEKSDIEKYLMSRGDLF